MKPRVLVPLGRGVEELEAVAAIDVLRRGGCHVVTASVGSANPIVGRNRIRLLADIDLADALTEWSEEWDLVLLPGGLDGVQAMRDSAALMQLLKGRLQRGGWVAAICAAPILLVEAGLSPGVSMTCHPGVVASLLETASAAPSLCEQPVVVDGAVITSRGAGTAVEFALACLDALRGAEVTASVRAQIVA